MSTQADADAKTTVLIVSDDATAAALLGGLVETLGYRVTFAKVTTSGEVIRRVRPRVCMLDCEADACNEAALARVMMRGVSVVLVGPRALLEGMRDVASRHGAEMVFTPPEPGPLSEALARAVRRTSV
jgi:DNA-binding NtrC family response regulator